MSQYRGQNYQRTYRAHSKGRKVSKGEQAIDEIGNTYGAYTIVSRSRPIRTSSGKGRGSAGAAWIAMCTECGDTIKVAGKTLRRGRHPMVCYACGNQ